MTNCREILRLHRHRINNTHVAESCGCTRRTIISMVQRALEKGISWDDFRSLDEAEVSRRLYPFTSIGPMSDHEYVHQEIQNTMEQPLSSPDPGSPGIRLLRKGLWDMIFTWILAAFQNQ